jgi:hypothetical protein
VRRPSLHVVLLLAVLLVAGHAPVEAGATEPSPPPGNACAVLDPDTVWCFDTEAEMEAATASLGGARAARDGADADAYCNGQSGLWLYLYEGLNMTGRVVKFRDVSVWFNLSAYGFDNITSSWRNETYCKANLAEFASGGGTWLVLAARSQSSQVTSTWDNRGSSVYLVP